MIYSLLPTVSSDPLVFLFEYCFLLKEGNWDIFFSFLIQGVPDLMNFALR